jgi:hypothetical protein
VRSLSITIPAGIAASLSMPGLSLVDGTAVTERVTVHSLGGTLLRRAIRMSMPLDQAAASVAHRTERMYRIRQYVFRPSMVLASLILFVGIYVYFVVHDAAGPYPWWIPIPVAVVAVADEIFDWLVSRSALPQHPRRERRYVQISEIPEAVAQEIVRLNPEVSIVQ